jgi:hypothetical protein
MTSKAGTWIAGAVGALLYAAVEIAVHEATFGPNAVRVGEVLWVVVVVVLGVALAACVWFGWRQDRRERSDKWLP